jgi:DNA-binding beta-propeller fold protein YncE
MRPRLTPFTALVMAAAWLGGCGSSSAPSAPRAAIAPAGAPPVVRCGAPPTQPGPARPRQTGRLALPGSPDGIATTPNGQTSFVAIQTGAPRIAVIANGPGGPRLLRTVAVPATASGMRVTPDGRYALAAAGSGAVVISVAVARSGRGQAVLGALRAPADVAGRGPGAAEVAVSPDARHVFVTLEGAGLVAVFDLPAALAGGAALGARGYLGAVPVGAGALGLSVSPDGRRLYEVSESAVVAGQRPGALNVIDTARALRTPRRAVVARVSAPCAPVRVAASPNGITVWVTARDANSLLGYSTAALARAPSRALASVTRVGPTPLGLVVVDSGHRVLVADADLADAIAPAAGNRALVTDSDGRSLQVLSLPQLP